MCYPARMTRVSSRMALSVLLLTVLLAGFALAETPTPPAQPNAMPLPTYAWPYDVVLAAPHWLAAHASDANIRIVDVSERAQYLEGHVPGAVPVVWQDLIERNSATYGRLAGRPERARVFGDLGIAPDTTVVVYDRNDSRAAARTAWAFWYAGHPNVRILNGGLAAWAAAGQPIERAAHTASRLPYRDLPDESVHANRCDTFTAATDGGSLLLDVRTDTEMRETWDKTITIGAIPGAIRVPWTTFIENPNAPALRPPDALRAELARVGATPERNIIVYGTFSNDAALPFFALKALGYVHVRLYDGGWAEYGANPLAAPALGPPCG